jgi:hypothetical protein
MSIRFVRNGPTKIFDLVVVKAFRRGIREEYPGCSRFEPNDTFVGA